MAITPEHALQTKVNQFVRLWVPMPHFFCSIDRSKQTGRFTHAREKMRGLLAGSPDTILVCPRLPLIAVELKAPGNQPTQRQHEVGAAIVASGHHWDWCSSVSGYAMILARFGVPLHRGWELAADTHDATLKGAAIKREEGRTGKPSRARFAPKKASVARIQKVERMRAGEIKF